MTHAINASKWVLGLICLVVIWNSVQTWVKPQTVTTRAKGSPTGDSPKAMNPLKIARDTAGDRAVEQVVRHNLFRPSREAFPRPAPSSSRSGRPSDLQIPPPTLQLKGVMLLNGTPIAIIEGAYPVRQPNNSIQKKPVKRKGYYLGDRIGNYEITDIGRQTVTLDNRRGRQLKIKLDSRRNQTPIKRQDNRLVQKNKNADPALIKPEKTRPAPQSGAKARAPSRPNQANPKPTSSPSDDRVSGN